jgi:hypothetical protein
MPKEPEPVDPSSHQAQEKFDLILRLIGEVVVKWAQLDEPLIKLLASLSNCSLRAAGITFYSLNSTGARYDLLSGLARHNITGGQQQEVLDLISGLREHTNSRNDIIHAVYRIAYFPDKKRNKWRVTKHLFRSQRKELFVETEGQTGEIETHIKKLDAFLLRLHLAPIVGTRLPSTRHRKKN